MFFPFIKRFLKTFSSVLIFSASVQLISAQEQTSSFSETGSDRYFELKFQNDIFFKTDYYYTNGILLNFTFPKFKKSPFNKLLIPVKAPSLNYYQIGFAQKFYTPLYINKTGIQYDDRPYSSILYMSHKRTSFIAVKKAKISHELLTGIIGAYSFGNKTQQGFHEMINNKIPSGWDYQIANDLILNYNYRYETELFSSHFFEFTGFGAIRAGTLYDDIASGLTMRLGWFNPQYTGFGQINTDKPQGYGLKKWQAFIFVGGKAQAVFYNATLQGGMLNPNSPYTLKFQDINHLVTELTYGFTLQYTGFELTAKAFMLSPEIIGGRNHGWLSINLRFNF